MICFDLEDVGISIQHLSLISKTKTVEKVNNGEGWHAQKNYLHASYIGIFEYVDPTYRDTL